MQVAALFLGSALIFVTGVAWLSSLIGIGSAVQHGLVPFIPGMFVKLALAVAVLKAGWAVVHKLRG